MITFSRYCELNSNNNFPLLAGATGESNFKNRRLKYIYEHHITIYNNGVEIKMRNMYYAGLVRLEPLVEMYRINKCRINAV